MNFQQYKPLALRTEKPLPSTHLRLNHAILGLATENGEFTTTVKRIAIYEKPISVEFIGHMREELGDLLWYVAIAADAIDCDIPEYQYLFEDYESFDTPTQLNMVACRITMEVGFIAFQAPLLHDARSRESIMRGLLNIVCSVSHACDALGFAIEDLMVENIDKLQKRFPEKYTNAAAEGRADKGGLDARNS
jgi:NTP pyrophosphatase (non-canonical NTP hydrolase)